MNRNHAEMVMPGHPDKVADIISDSILDVCLSHDPKARVAGRHNALRLVLSALGAHMKRDAWEVAVFLVPFMVLSVLFSQCGCGSFAEQGLVGPNKRYGLGLLPSPDAYAMTERVVAAVNVAADRELLYIGAGTIVRFQKVPKFCGTYDPFRDEILIVCQLDNVLIHEIGHALGINEHSKDLDSVMYESVRPMTVEAAAASLIKELRVHGQFP